MAAEIGSLLAELVAAVVMLDHNQRIVWFGGQMEELAKARVGEPFADLFPLTPEGRKALRGSAPQRLTFSTPRGRRLLLRMWPLSMSGGPVTAILIEEQTSLTQNQAIRLACLEQIVDSLSEGVIMSDYEGRLALYNKAQEKLEGLRGENVIGKYLWEAYNYNPEMSEHRRVFQTKKPVIGQYGAHAYTNGSPQYIMYSTYPIVKDGETIAVFSVSTNETRLKNLLHETVELRRQIMSPEQERKDRPSNGTSYTFDHIRGNSPALQQLIAEAQEIAMHNTDVLIVGETGTGKELFAQSIHNHSQRSRSPFVAVNCAAIPETLLESTLFGTVKGAYTGAADQMGLFEHAQDGTLFLDEINSMPITLQAKLMRVLEERMVRRLGTTAITPVRCMIISASNEDPRELIASNRLRLDLYYRIARTCLFLSPLRERKEDILFLIDHFISQYGTAWNKSVDGVTERLREILLKYRWPGNTRELQHVIENLVIRADKEQALLDIGNIPAYLHETMLHQRAVESPRSEPVLQSGGGRIGRSLKSAHNDQEKRVIQDTLEQTGWNITRAAEILGTTRQSLQYHIRRLAVRKPAE